MAHADPHRKSAVLRKLYPEQPFVEINPADATLMGIRQNERSSSRRNADACRPWRC